MDFWESLIFVENINTLLPGQTLSCSGDTLCLAQLVGALLSIVQNSATCVTDAAEWQVRQRLHWMSHTKQITEMLNGYWLTMPKKSCSSIATAATPTRHSKYQKALRTVSLDICINHCNIPPGISIIWILAALYLKMFYHLKYAGFLNYIINVLKKTEKKIKSNLDPIKFKLMENALLALLRSQGDHRCLIFFPNSIVKKKKLVSLYSHKPEITIKV